MLVQKGDWGRALPMARKALAFRPDRPKARGNLGLALMALGQWKEGWPMYDAIIGFDKSRRKMQYVNEQTWNGKKGRSVVIYEEQGIGDCISFASMVPDAIRDCHKVILDVSPKLENLFRRSFPQATVYGSITGLGKDWRRDHRIDASISIGGLGKLYRPSPESCPGVPYLKPDPDRVTMWKGLFRSFGKPVIGVAWTGGLDHTGAKYRKFSLEQLMPLFRMDAVFVSLQYKDAQAEIDAFRKRHPEVDIRQFPFGTLTDDYDDTAAMVSALDVTVALPTSVVHLAGALGAPCVAMKAKIACWKFNCGLPFHRENMTLVDHEGDWDGTIRKTAEVVKERLGV